MKDATDVNFGGQVGSGVLAQFTMAVIGFTGSVIFARVLGPAGFGGFYLLMAIVRILDRPARGWGGASKKRISEHNFSDPYKVVGSLYMFIVGTIVVGGALMWFFEDWISSFTGLNSPALAGTALLGSTLLFMATQKIMSATGREGVVRWSDTFRSVLTLPLQVGFVLIGFGALGMAYGLAIASLLSIPIIVYFLSFSIAPPSRKVVMSLWTYAKFEIPNVSIRTLYGRFDIMLIGYVLGPGPSGLYEAASKFVEPTMYVPNVSSGTLMARISNYDEIGTELIRDINNTIAFASILAIPIFFGSLSISRRLIVTVYGTEYREAYVILILLTFYYVFRTQNKVFTNVIAGLDIPEINTRILSGSVTVNVVLGVLLVFEFGAEGVVAATVAAGFVQYLLNMRVVKIRMPDVKPFPAVVRKQIASGIIMYLGVEMLTQVVEITSWFLLGGVLVTGAVLYITMLGIISHHARNTLVNVATQTVLKHK